MITQTSTEAKFLYGNHASLRIGQIAKEKGYSKVFMVTDKGVYNAGIVEPLIENLKTAGVETVLFAEVTADPPDTMVNEGGALAKEAQVDAIIAVGGGSSIDAAKMINILVNNDAPINQYIAPAMAPNPLLPMILVPTTAGTGSECTLVAVLTETATSHKAGVVAVSQNTVIVDPTLYVGMPVKPSIYCAFDVIAHAVDAICHFDSEPVACTFAEKALRLVFKNLHKVIENPKDLEARGAMALAASYGGAAIQGNMCHVTHSIGHSLGSVFHLPHGLGCSAALPELLRLYAEWTPKQAKLVAECMGLEFAEDISNAELGEKLHDWMLAYMKSVGIESMKEIGLSLEDILTKALPMMPNDQPNVYSPRLMGASEFKAILEEAYDH